MSSPQNKLLNGMQRLLIDFANDNGISLRDEFGTVDQFKQFVMAFTFKVLIDEGFSVPDAFDRTFGDGSYSQLVDRLYGQLSTSAN